MSHRLEKIRILRRTAKGRYAEEGLYRMTVFLAAV